MLLLCNLQQPNKKNNDDNYLKFLDILRVNESFVMNSNAKSAIKTSNEKPYKKELNLENNQKPNQTPAKIRSTPRKKKTVESVSSKKKDLKAQKKTANPRKGGVGILSQSERTLLESKYTVVLPQMTA